MKSWDDNWETVYLARGYRAKYPNESLIRFMVGSYNSELNRNKIRVLDIGCGPGANVWYLAKEGFSTYGIDGSPKAIQLCRDRLKNEGLAANISVGDIAELPYESEFFDAVVDVASIQHNAPENIQIILDEVARVLVNGGRLFSWVRAYCDLNADNSIVGNPFHLFTLPEIKEWYGSLFTTLNIEYTERTIGGMSKKIAHYIISGVKV
jgi:SAM-dependent methyltransferase